jgi:hypothetical protein
MAVPDAAGVDLLLTDCRLPDGRGPVDLAISQGRLVTPAPVPGSPRETVAVGGRLTARS